MVKLAVARTSRTIRDANPLQRAFANRSYSALGLRRRPVGYLHVVCAIDGLSVGLAAAEIKALVLRITKGPAASRVVDREYGLALRHSIVTGLAIRFCDYPQAVLLARVAVLFAQSSEYRVG